MGWVFEDKRTDAEKLQDRVMEMDDNGYTHKPLARVDILDEDVLDTLEGWGVFDFTIHSREFVEPDQYACVMTDRDDIERDSWLSPGTSCMIVHPVFGGAGYIISRHSHDGRWEPPFTNVWDTFDEACEALMHAAQWESNNRKALAEYRGAA